MNLYAFLSVSTSVIVFFWGTFVFSKETKDPPIQAFLLFSVVTTYVAALEFLFISSHSIEEAEFFFNFQILGWPILYAAQFHFLLLYGEFNFKRKKLLIYVLYAIAFALVSAIATSNIFSESIIQDLGGWIRKPSDIKSVSEIIFAIYMTTMTFAVSWLSIKHLRNAESKREKLRASLVMAGILIPTWLPFLKNAIVPGILKISILFPDSPFILFGWMFLAVAIVYFKMFDLSPRNVADKILATMNEALIMSNKDGKIIWANRRFFELFEFDNLKSDEDNLDFLNQANLNSIGITGKKLFKKEHKNTIVQITTVKNNTLYVGINSAFLKDKLQEDYGIVTIFNDMNDLILAQIEIKNQQQQMLAMAHQAGMSEITTSVMHNIGNILNSVNVSTEYINNLIGKSKISNLVKANEMLQEHKNDLSTFFTTDPKGKILPDYYIKLGYELTSELEKLKYEGQVLSDKINLIKEAIEIQQDYSSVRNLNEPILINNMIDEVSTILEESFKKYEITLNKKYNVENELTVIAPSSKLLNVILNVIKNAVESAKLNIESERIIEIGINEKDSRLIQLIIEDNGPGIPDDVMPNIFKFGFTTKQTGHGFGLHFCANVLKEINGSISAANKKNGQGAQFTIVIPKQAAE